MTATGPVDPAAEDAAGESTSTDHQYFRALEDLFIRLRGSPLLLSPSDYEVARQWRRLGIPLGLAGRVMGEVFQKRKERGGDDRPVSLRYFRRPVEGAWKSIREMQAGGERDEAPTFDLAGRLERLAAALPEDWPDRQRWHERLLALAEGEEGQAPALEAVESRLEALDGDLLAAAEARLDQDAAAALTLEVEAALERVAVHLPAEELERSRRELHRRRLRARWGLPLLSLFSPVAEGS